MQIKTLLKAVYHLSSCLILGAQADVWCCNYHCPVPALLSSTENTTAADLVDNDEKVCTGDIVLPKRQTILRIQDPMLSRSWEASWERHHGISLQTSKANK